MGMCYRAVTMFGKYFEDFSELKDFVTEVYPDAEVDREGIYEVPVLASIELECLDLYSGRGYIIGYSVVLGEALDTVTALWETAFPNVAARAHSEVKIS